MKTYIKIWNNSNNKLSYYQFLTAIMALHIELAEDLKWKIKISPLLYKVKENQDYAGSYKSAIVLNYNKEDKIISISLSAIKNHNYESNDLIILDIIKFYEFNYYFIKRYLLLENKIDLNIEDEYDILRKLFYTENYRYHLLSNKKLLFNFMLSNNKFNNKDLNPLKKLNNIIDNKLDFNIISFTIGAKMKESIIITDELFVEIFGSTSQQMIDNSKNIIDHTSNQEMTKYSDYGSINGGAARIIREKSKSIINIDGKTIYNNEFLEMSDLEMGQLLKIIDNIDSENIIKINLLEINNYLYSNNNNQKEFKFLFLNYNIEANRIANELKIADIYVFEIKKDFIIPKLTRYKLEIEDNTIIIKEN